MTRLEIEELVRTVARTVLESLVENASGNCGGECGCSSEPSSMEAADSSKIRSFDGKVLTEGKVLELLQQGLKSISLPAGILVTPLARDVAAEKGLLLHSSAAVPGYGPSLQSDSEAVLVILTGQSRSEERVVVEASEGAGLRSHVYRTEETSKRTIREAVEQGAYRLSRGEIGNVIVLADDIFQLSFQVSKLNGVKPLVCWDVQTALESKKECGSNFLLLNPRQLGMPMLGKIVSSWLGNA